MLTRYAITLSILPGLISRAAVAESPHETMGGANLNSLENTKWVSGPASLPKGAMIAVLEGDPNKEGPFAFRIKAPDGYQIPPHTHPKTERVTVLSGTFHIGMGEKFDAKATQAMPAGTYGHWPAGMKHFVRVEGETIVQFHGDGPWIITYLNPADDPRKADARARVEFTEDTLEDVKRNVAEGKAVLVDVRSREEWNRGNIEGALFVPFRPLQEGDVDPEKLAQTLPKGKILYTFCVVGMRSKAAAKILSGQGYEVRALKPGYDELIEAGFELESQR